jgi:hypothetical protein
MAISYKASTGRSSLPSLDLYQPPGSCRSPLWREIADRPNHRFEDIGEATAEETKILHIQGPQLLFAMDPITRRKSTQSPVQGLPNKTSSLAHLSH